jgi:EAL domain-containing protein (putative c-di-GMP-specific phosphodiesterase class I)
MRAIHFDGVRAQSVRITASVGIAWTDRRVTTDEFVARSRRALAEAKRRGRARAWLEQSSDGEASPRGGPTMAELNAALRREEFELVYQPIVSALDGRTRAVEALLRWRHPEHGLLAPNRFLGWLLENGQIGPVGQWVVRTSISQLGHWKRSHPALCDLALHVNLTAAELALPELPALLRNEIELAEIDPAAVCIEVTEQALSGVMVSPSTLTQVADVGVRIVLDDFGTGISSLSHLRTKPLHGIKVDRSFVVGAENDPNERSIVEGVVAIAAGLGIETTAEGVETSEQAQWLTDLGCTFLQGYHFARPGAADAVPALVGN